MRLGCAKAYIFYLNWDVRRRIHSFSQKIKFPLGLNTCYGTIRLYESQITTAHKIQILLRDRAPFVRDKLLKASTIGRATSHNLTTYQVPNVLDRVETLQLGRSRQVICSIWLQGTFNFSNRGIQTGRRSLFR